ncbi:MAG TPA: ABC transporter permease subunit [Hydrogenophaga sp.]|uniref:ABC transporter permease n=1 Tax=Hydrogenophaga sp. TaxID=1904254 RepID=UPI002B8D3272|nr:ABC transporter permease [Hydrogenophaga sp.]HMN94711.1 ABC transporter permease subunit [Hydrogenophaga sp.]HMP08923.1 ABC transporter permease subunit [Hydrogenophaga sp.]
MALLAVVLAPLLAVAVLAGQSLGDPAAWAALWRAPQTPSALALTLWTGLASTALAWWISAWLLAQAFVRQGLLHMTRALPAMLATPHAALAIGLVFLVAPSGWLLRAVSPWLTGFEFPPPWPTTQDPWGLGLIVALVLKEVPFLLWTAASQLQREDVRRRWLAEHSLAQTLGYGPSRAWWRVVWPQLAPRLWWPLMAVLAYGLTVVDMAMVIGPASPPTLAVLAWQWLQDADLAVNAQGAAAGGLLALLVLVGGLGWWGLSRLGLRLPDGRRGSLPCTSNGPSGSRPGTPWAWRALVLTYAAILLALAVGSVAGVWPFPRLLPEAWTLQAWRSVWASAGTVTDTLLLAATSSLLSLLWCVAWLELAPRHWDNTLRPLLYLPLVLPGVLWVVGLYGLVLRLHWEGQWTGLLLAHTTLVLPYVLLALSPAYLGFDPRYRGLAASLGHGRWHFLWRVKWPLLRRALAASAAVGFAVSVAQYLPTLYVGAGRWNTVTTEAVTLAAGAQRSLTGAYAWLQFVLPVLGFALAAWVGRPRRFTVSHP